MANGQPRPAFYAAVLLVVVGLVGVALWRYGALGPGGRFGRISNDELKQMQKGAEAPDSSGITTVKEYNYVASSRLPAVKGISNYKPLADRTVRFAINVWAGWGPIIYANNGFKPGKTIVLPQNSPSHFFILNALINAGVQPAEVEFKFTQDAFQAAAAFNADRRLAGCVSWAPDIYNLEKVKGNRLIVTTSTANKLIADVWFARADFANDNPDIMEGISRGIFDAMHDLKVQEAKQKVAKLMAAGYSIPESDALGMLGDAHSTNYAENRDFFLNQNNPTNF